MKQKEFEALKKRIQDRYDEDMEALKRVWKMSVEIDGKNGSTSDAGPRRELPKCVKQIVAASTKHFTASDIEAQVKTDRPDLTAKLKSISVLLWRMAKNGEIQVFTKGRPGSPTVYKK